MSPFSPEHARQTVEEVVKKLARCPMNDQARKAEIRGLAWTLVQVYKKQKQPAGWSAVKGNHEQVV